MAYIYWGRSKIGEERRINMLPKNDLFWKWKLIYDELCDPFTETVEDKYFLPILETQFKYCKEKGFPISLAVLNLPNLLNAAHGTPTLETYLSIRNITNIIRKRLLNEGMIFYNGRQTFLFLSPNINKGYFQRLLEVIKIDLEYTNLSDTLLTIKGGFAEFPTDAKDPVELRECAGMALNIASQSNENRILGYFIERRKNIRVPIQIEVRYIALKSQERITCSRNISETGIMLSGVRDISKGDKIELILGMTNISLLAKTIWNKICIKTQKIDTGLCFTYLKETAKEQIRKFISNPLPPIAHL